MEDQGICSDTFFNFHSTRGHVAIKTRPICVAKLEALYKIAFPAGMKWKKGMPFPDIRVFSRGNVGDHAGVNGDVGVKNSNTANTKNNNAANIIKNNNAAGVVAGAVASAGNAGDTCTHYLILY